MSSLSLLAGMVAKILDKNKITTMTTTVADRTIKELMQACLLTHMAEFLPQLMLYFLNLFETHDQMLSTADLKYA